MFSNKKYVALPYGAKKLYELLRYALKEKSSMGDLEEACKGEYTVRTIRKYIQILLREKLIYVEKLPMKVPSCYGKMAIQNIKHYGVIK